MLILKALLLGGIVAVHVVGAAFVFRRLFPRDSRWLAFVLPELLFVLVCNFGEHLVPLTYLRGLLPFTTAGAVAAMVWRRSPWRTMRLPTLIFLGAFTFTLGLRVLRPGIMEAQDGADDLSIMADFLYGQSLPAEATWLPPLKMEGYYWLAHYGASVLTRLFGVEIGTGFNLSTALLSAYVYFIVGGVAWHVSRGKLWNVVLCLLLTACAATGSAGYLWLTVKPLVPDNIIDPYSLFDLKPAPDNLLVRNLTPIDYAYDRHVLLPPGYGSWVGYLHSAQAGQFLIGLCLLALIEALRRRRTDVPWLILAVAPFLLLTSCTWGLPMLGFLAMAGTIACLRLKVGPRNPRVVLAVSAGVIVLLEPMLVYFLAGTPTVPFIWATGCHTQLAEFFLQWWPIYLPGLLLAFAWKRLHPVTRMVLIMTPLAFTGAEIWTMWQRVDTTEKFWALIFAAAWMTFLPEIIRRREWGFRVVLGLIVVNSLLGLGFWTGYTSRGVNTADIAHLEGLGQFRLDRRKARILEVVSRFPDQTILPGISGWAWGENGLLPLFSHTRAYVTWHFFCDDAYYPQGLREARRRAGVANQLYAGTMSNPLYYLRQQDIAALVVYPDDNLSPSLVAQLKTQLAPYYTYDDANSRTPSEVEKDVNPGNPAAGVFVYHPEITTLLGEPKTQGAK